VYPDDKRRADVPEIWMCSADVIRELGWFACPSMSHFYIDNVVAELGKRSGLIRYCPEAEIPHHHYQVDPSVERDRTYRETEEAWGQSDLAAFQAWQADIAPLEVARLRRRFSKDIEWVTSLIA
jgi:hypothetical protein